MSKPNPESGPRTWRIPAGVGSYYDGRKVHYAVGPLLNRTQELSVEVVEHSALVAAEKRIAELELEITGKCVEFLHARERAEAAQARVKELEKEVQLLARYQPDPDDEP